MGMDSSRETSMTNWRPWVAQSARKRLPPRQILNASVVAAWTRTKLYKTQDALPRARMFTTQSQEFRSLDFIWRKVPPKILQSWRAAPQASRPSTSLGAIAALLDLRLLGTSARPWKLAAVIEVSPTVSASVKHWFWQGRNGTIHPTPRQVSSVIRLVIFGEALPVYAVVGAGGLWLHGTKVSANVLQVGAWRWLGQGIVGEGWLAIEARWKHKCHEQSKWY